MTIKNKVSDQFIYKPIKSIFKGCESMTQMKNKTFSDSSKQYVSTACPLDCWDSCAISATVEEGKIISLAGNPSNPVTGEHLCSKGMHHLQRRTHPKRLYQPMIKRNGSFEAISWEDALTLIATKMNDIKENYPTTAVLHCNYAGSVGLLKQLETRFFSAYGGVTTSTGSLCAGAGQQAQLYDFGKVLSHEISDVVNSKMVLIWGRNPSETGIHAMPFLKTAKEKGAQIVVIDPRASLTSKGLSARHIAPKPGTDAALALAMAHVIIHEDLIDHNFIASHVSGYEDFKAIALSMTPEMASVITGIERETIVEIARLYGTIKPACILLGYGVQRYTNGGDTVRAIDALGAITGNIGIEGGGVNYNNASADDLIEDEVFSGKSLRHFERNCPRPYMADFILTAVDPPVKMLFVTRSNPITQFMETSKMVKAFNHVDFKVTIDHFMTDTALASDLVLPCAYFLETTDVVMPPAVHSYITYCSPVVQPDPWVPSERWIYSELAKRMAMHTFPQWDSNQWLEAGLAPLFQKTGWSLQTLKNGPVKCPGIGTIAWDDLKFPTPSERIELSSEKALTDGFEQTAVFKPIKAEPTQQYPFFLITPHIGASLHSQHFLDAPDTQLPIVYLNDVKATELSLIQGDFAEVFSETGTLICEVNVSKDLNPEIVTIHEGWWLQNKGGVNKLIPEQYSKMGMHAAYYETVCGVRKVNKQLDERKGAVL